MDFIGFLSIFATGPDIGRRGLRRAAWVIPEVPAAPRSQSMTFLGPLGLLQLSWDRRTDWKAAPEGEMPVQLAR